MPHSALVTSLFYVNLGYIIATKKWTFCHKRSQLLLDIFFFYFLPVFRQVSFYHAMAKFWVKRCKLVIKPGLLFQNLAIPFVIYETSKSKEFEKKIYHENKVLNKITVY